MAVGAACCTDVSSGTRGRRNLTLIDGPRRRMRCTPLTTCTRTCPIRYESEASNPERPGSDWSPGKAAKLFSLHGTPFGSRRTDTGRTSKIAAPPPSKKKAKKAKISPAGVQPLTAAEQSDAVARKVLGESSAFLGILPTDASRPPRRQQVSQSLQSLSQNRRFVGPPRLCNRPVGWLK